MTDGRNKSCLPPLPAESGDGMRRRILETLDRQEYGVLPRREKSVGFCEVSRESSRFMAGKAEKRVMRITSVFDGGEHSFEVSAVIPRAHRPVPFFICPNFHSPVPNLYYPAEEIADLGFGVLHFYYKDVTCDRAFDSGDDQGVARLFFKTEAEARRCGKLSVWAWAASRVLDLAGTLEGLDMRYAGVIGHSRLGKTALLAAARDERFFAAFSNDSGCSGAALHRYKNDKAENVAAITKTFPYWFTGDFGKYAGREDSLPFDQHWLIAALCPRFVCVGSAAGDLWAAPDSELASCRAASPAWESRGLRGFEEPRETGDRMKSFGGRVGYYRRPGPHWFSRSDWRDAAEFFRLKIEEKEARYGL